MVFGWSHILKAVKPLIGIGSLTFEKVMNIPFAGSESEGAESVYVVNEQVCIIGLDSVQVYDKSGAFLSEQPFNAIKPVIKVSGKHILLGDLELGEYIVLDSSGKAVKASHELGKLDDIWLGNDLTILSLKNSRTEIQVVLPDSEDIINIEIPRGRIIDMSYSPEDHKVAVMVLDSETSPFVSSVYQYTTTGDLLGFTNFKEQIIYDAHYDYTGLVVITDAALVSINDSAKINWERKWDGIVNKYTWNSKHIIINKILTEESITELEATNVIEQVKWTGEFQSSFELQTDINRVNADHPKYILTYDDQLLTVYSENGNVEAERTVKSVIQKIAWLSRDRLIIVYNNEVEIFDLTY